MSYTPIVFENSLGEEISNDPVYLAQKTLKDAGVTFQNSQPDVAKAQLQQATDKARQPAQDDDALDDDEQPDLDDSGFRTYKELDGKGVQAEAKSRGIIAKDLGIKTVGDLRTALIQDDETKRADADAAGAQAAKDANSGTKSKTK